METEAGPEADRQMYFSFQCPVSSVKYKYNTSTVQDRDKHLSVYTVEQLRGAPEHGESEEVGEGGWRANEEVVQQPSSYGIQCALIVFNYSKYSTMQHLKGL